MLDLVSSCTDLISVAISSVDADVLSARSFISFATTENPLPCSPALEARIAAFRERRLVWLTTSPITLIILPISSVLLPSMFITSERVTTLFFILSIPSIAEVAAFIPLSEALIMTASARTTDSLARFSISLVVAWTSSIEDETCSDDTDRFSRLSAICLIVATISSIDEAVSWAVSLKIFAFSAIFSMDVFI